MIDLLKGNIWPWGPIQLLIAQYTYISEEIQKIIIEYSKLYHCSLQQSIDLIDRRSIYKEELASLMIKHALD